MCSCCGMILQRMLSVEEVCSCAGLESGCDKAAQVTACRPENLLLARNRQQAITHMVMLCVLHMSM